MEAGWIGDYIKLCRCKLNILTVMFILIFRLVFKQTKQLLGGRVRLILSGGAPLSPDTHEMIKVCLCDRVIQGYGLTETCSCATVMDSKFIV